MNTSVSPYTTTVPIEGHDIHIRPIRREDTALEQYFIKRLSAKTKHDRFLGGVNQLPADELRRLCDVDYHDSMAFIALTDDLGLEQQVGVVRYVKDQASRTHEMAVTIADDYHDSSLAKVLVEQLFAYGKKHGVKTIYSMDSNYNADMRKLAKDLGMIANRDPNDTHQVIYSINIAANTEPVAG